MSSLLQKAADLIRHDCFCVYSKDRWKLYGSYGNPMSDLSRVMPKFIRDMCQDAKFVTHRQTRMALVHKDTILPIRFCNFDGQIVSVLCAEGEATNWMLPRVSDYSAIDRLEG